MLSLQVAFRLSIITARLLISESHCKTTDDLSTTVYISQIDFDTFTYINTLKSLRAYANAHNTQMHILYVLNI